MAPPPGNETNKVPLPGNLSPEAGSTGLASFQSPCAGAVLSARARSRLHAIPLRVFSLAGTPATNLLCFGGGAWLPGRTPIGPTARLSPPGRCYVCSLCAYWSWRTILRGRGRGRREGSPWIGRCQNEGRSLSAGRLGGERRVFSALRTGAEEAAVAPGAFERAHPSPRANADPGPTGGTAPDSPRAFLAAMEDGVYGRSGRGGAGWERMERLDWNVRPRTSLPARAARRLGAPSKPRFCGARNGLPAGPESRAFQAIVWAEPVSGGGGGGRDGAAEARPGRNHSRWKGRASPVPAGSREGGFWGAWLGRNLGGCGDPAKAGRGPSMPRPPFPNSQELSPAFPAVVTFHGPRSPDTQAPSCLARNGGREPRPHSPSK